MSKHTTPHKTKYRSVDLTKHGDATHPRIGAVDHVSLHPLGSTPLEAAREAALQVSKGVTRIDTQTMMYLLSVHGQTLPAQ